MSDAQMPVEMPVEMTDGFHLVVEALKLNGVDTIFGVAGIPITDLLRLAQQEGIRYYGFRHEQSAGNAAAIAGFLTQKPGICMTVSAPGFLNGLVALANATTNCFPMVLISGSSDRAIVDLEQGDYEEMDQLAAARPYAKAAYRVNRPQDIGIGIARAIRAAVSGRPGGVYLDLTAEVLASGLDADSGEEVADKSRRSGAAEHPGPGRGRPRARPAGISATAARDPRQGRRLCPGRRGNPQLYRDDRHPVPADVDGQGPVARRPSAIGRRRPLLCDRQCRCRAGGRGAAQLAPVAWPRALVERERAPDPGRYLADRDRQQPGDRRAGDRRHQIGLLSIQRRAEDPSQAAGAWMDEIGKRKTQNVERMAARLNADPNPMNFSSALSAVRNALPTQPDVYIVNEGANTLDFGRNIIDMHLPRHRLDSGTWGVMGIGMGYAVGAAAVTGKPVVAIEGDSAFGFSGMEIETICRYELPVTTIIFNNNGVYRGDPEGRPYSPTGLIRGARYEKLIEAFGGKGYHVTDTPGLTNALSEALASGKPALINAVIDPTAGTESGHIQSLNPKSAVAPKT